MADSSDDPTRPGWWRASDGKLYPPELHPRAASPTAPPPSPSPAQTPSVSPPPGPSGAGPPGTPWSGPPPTQGAWSPDPSAASGSGTPGLAIAALILGAGALAFSFIPVFGFSSIPFAIAGIGLGIAGIVRASKGAGGKGLSIAGIATGTGALIVSVAWGLFFGLLVNSDSSDGFCDDDRTLQDPDC